MTRTFRWLALIGVPVLLALVVPLPYATEAADNGLCDTNGRPANLNFTLKDQDGRDVNLASLKGKVILLDFWATWCPPCKVEMPWFVEFQSTYGPKGLSVIGVSVDDSVAKLKAFAASSRTNYPLLLGEGRDDVKGPKAYDAGSVLPKTFVIGRDGRICKSHLGLSSKDKFEQEIKALL